MVLAGNSSQTTWGGRDRDWNRAVLAACPSLRSGCRPPLWARNPHIQNVLTVARDRNAPPADWDLEERIVAADAGTISVQWLGLDAPAHTPVLVAMHTICGSGDGLRRYLAPIVRRLGWVVAACNRRGHGDLPLTAPSVNTMGSTADLDLQLDAIQARRAQAPLYGLGVSAGSGLLVRYLGEQGRRSRLRAAIAVCPAYDVPEAFGRVHPVYDKWLTRRLVEFFLLRNRQVLSTVDGYAECAAARSIVAFHEHLYPLSGYRSLQDWNRHCNPMEVAMEATTPVLVINSSDDPVCVEANVHRHRAAMTELDRMTLVLTRHGSHCGFFEGTGARANWLEQAMVEYLRAAHQLLDGAPDVVRRSASGPASATGALPSASAAS
jgi:predicted alpha/beta-fold hydrolase